MESQNRESFASRIGFILVSAGCAIGIGNVWKFPYITGVNGGGWFVLFYLIFLLIMGVPILTMELAVGRASRKSAVLAYKALEKPGSKWHIHGWVAIIGCVILMMYYTTVSGWMVDYFVKFVTGTFTPGMTADEVGGVFNTMLSKPVEMSFFTILTILAGFLICSKGLQNGLEKLNTFMMTALIILILVLAVNSLLLPGAGEGMSFYLIPNMENVKKVGILNAAAAAMNQSFFTLSLGVAAMEIFGSYMSKAQRLPGEAVRICILDTFVAISSGIIIFPACFSFGVQPDQGPSLIFVTLPNVFNSMAGGRLWGSLFFIFMTFASFSTVIAVFENIISFTVDMFGISRKKASIINCILILILSMPCVLGYNVWSDVTFLGGKNFLDFEDFIVSNLLLPIGSLIFLLFCVTKWGWGFDNYINECNGGTGLKMPRIFKPYFQFVLPILILIILIRGLI
jgi:NSS family neurotransmitter:Na+ symporter